jgi:hypothetical protein
MRNKKEAIKSQMLAALEVESLVHANTAQQSASAVISKA